jgi:EAL domain-containing protein (putative c-di-GMP-specific phosphodiesterase class I)
MTSSGLPAEGCGACATAPELALAFTMAFQPVVDVEAGRIYGYEALVRGPDGESAKSILSQVDALNRYAFDQACRVKAIELAAALGMTGRLSINFMPNAVYEAKACIRRTLSTAARVGFPLDQISFEITEDERIDDHAHLRAIIEEYRRHGFLVALDDFGAGYAGLNLLADIRPDIIKLDIALVRDIDRDFTRRTLVLAMVGACHQLGIRVIAEGVERREELDVLRATGVTLFQGYYFARPTLGALVREAQVPALAA